MKKRFLALLLTLVMVFALVPAAAFAADGSEAEDPGTAAAEPAETRDAEGAKAGSKTYLAFTSDIHNGAGGIESNISNNRLTTWLSIVSPKYNNDIHVFGFCGDMAGANTGTDTFWTCTKKVMDNISDHSMAGVYAVGNHEYMNGSFSSTSNSPEVRAKYALNAEGRAEAGDNYVIYCLGTNSTHGSSWAYDDSQITEMTAYLNSVSNDKLIIILTHFPLHNYGGHRTSNTVPVLNAINDAVFGADGTYGTPDDKKIVFLWGHNHSEGDTNYDHIWTPGEKINDDSKSTVYFYYAAAGCMADTEYGQSASVKGKGLVLTIDEDLLLSFKYYDLNGNELATSGSYYTELPPVAIQSAAITQGTTTGTGGVPMVEETLPAGKTLQLTYSTIPSDATVKSVTWVSNNTAVATVEETTGKVRGVSEGTAKITATLSDGITRGQVVAEVLVNIGPRGAGPMYVLTDEFKAEKNYIIASANDGSAYALTNNSGSVGATAVEIEDETIYLDEENENIVFTTVGSGSSVTDITNNDRYLAITSNGSWSTSYSLTLNTSANNRAWTYSSNLLSSTRNSTSTTQYYVYYSANNSNFAVSSSSSSSSGSPRQVYLFEEVVEQIPVESVTVSPKTDEVMVRNSKPLTATVSPANATNKKVTWTSSDEGVAKVDENGNVRGVSEGTVTITATAGGKSDTATITVIPNPNPVAHYVIVINDFALSTDRSPNTAQGGSSSYTYTGLAGVAYTSGSAAADNIRWIFEETDGGYYIMSLDGRYLNATYTSGSNSGQGDLKLDTTKDVWVLDAGYSLDGGTVNGSYLKSSNASSTASSDKYLGYEEDQNLFTVRSESNADTVSISEASDPVAVTGVTLNMTTASVMARKTIQLTATIAPENATNKNVIWTSSDESVAKVESTGLVRGIAEGTAVITATSAENASIYAVCNVTVTPNDNPVQGCIIIIDGYALSTDRSPNTAYGNNNSTSYNYTGLAGVEYTTETEDNENIRWIIEETEGGYYIKSLDGRYLNATYTAVSNPTSSNPTKGDLKLDDTPDVWVLDGSLTDWMVDGCLLKSTNASNSSTSDKYLAYENSQNLFSVRSESNADESTMIDPSVTIVNKFVETDSFVDGKEYIIAVTKDATSVYAVRNASGTSSGNTDSVTLTVTPASGSDPAYIEEADTGAIWTFASSNNYLTNNSRYLSYDSSSYVPRASGSGRAITYTSGNKLQIDSRYLTCDNGTFGTSTSSSSGAAVRLFVKTIEISTCEHNWGTPTWAWDGEGFVKSRAASDITAAATFTCTKCGETKTVNATVTGPANGVYTATVTGPDGNTYTDTRAQAASGEYNFKLIPSKTDAKPGDTIDFQLVLEPVEHLGSMQVYIVVGNGLTYNSGTLAKTSEIEAAGLTVDTDDTNDLLVMGYKYGTDFASSEDKVVATFRCTVNEGFSGTASVTLDKDTWEFYDINLVDYTAQYDVTPGVVNVTPLTVTFNANGGTGTMAAQTVYKNVAANLTKNTFTRTGYEFDGWNTAADGTGTAYADEAEVTLQAGITLYAQWQAKNYTITFKNDDGTTLETKQVAYGTVPTYTGTTPTKAQTAQYTYTFSGWKEGNNTYTGALPAVTGDTTYTAVFTETVRTYTIIWKNYDGTVLETDQNVAYGTTPSYDGATPTRPATAQYTYTFNGWDPTPSAVSGDAEYTATFTTATNAYKVSGSITSWVATGHEGGTITIELIPSASGAQTLSTTATGTSATYTFNDVEVGTYTLKVSKADHATRTYDVTVSTGAVTQNVELNLLGDINGDGKVTAFDLSMADWFFRSKKEPTTYQFACADANADGELTTVDLAFINSHVKKASIIWDALTTQP